ncbi:MAG: YncE family protein [Archangiaceae bacterium]|nr:YncE family protein [Archangiaceae bacterium]
MNARLVTAVGLAALAACRPSSDPASPAPALVFSSEAKWPERSTYPGVGQGRLLITNSREDTVSLIDLSQVGQATLPELARAPVGLNPVEIEAPHHAAVSTDGKHWYTGLSQFAPGTGSGPHGAHGTGSVDGQVLKLSTADNRVEAVARVDRNPGDLALSPDGKRLAVSHYDLLRISEAARGTAPDPDARIAILDAETLERIAMVRTCAAPHGVRFSPDGRRLYVACYSDEVAVLDMTTDGFPVTRIPVASNAGTAYTATYNPYGVTVHPQTGDVFVSCLTKGEVRVLNAATLMMDPARTALVGGNPLLGDVSLDGTAVFIPHQGDDRISVLNPTTGQEERLIALPHDRCLAVHQVTVLDATHLAAVCEGDHSGPGSVLILDAASGAVVSSTNVGVFPDWVGTIRP